MISIAFFAKLGINRANIEVKVHQIRIIIQNNLMIKGLQAGSITPFSIHWHKKGETTMIHIFDLRPSPPPHSDPSDDYKAE